MIANLVIFNLSVYKILFIFSYTHIIVFFLISNYLNMKHIQELKLNSLVIASSKFWNSSFPKSWIDFISSYFELTLIFKNHLKLDFFLFSISSKSLENFCQAFPRCNLKKFYSTCVQIFFPIIWCIQKLKKIRHLLKYQAEY